MVSRVLSILINYLSCRSEFLDGEMEFETKCLIEDFFFWSRWVKFIFFISLLLLCFFSFFNINVRKKNIFTEPAIGLLFLYSKRRTSCGNGRSIV